jgi:hypothetical protein
MSSSEILIPRTPVDDRARPAGVVSPTEDLITAILGALVIGGALTDAWAHSNILAQVQAEGFFTPWHGLLYSAFAATAGWTFWLGYRNRQRTPRWWVDGWPAGYRLGALGAVTFLVAGFLDMIWHGVFGIETSIDALLSPSHLLLAVGSALLLTSPLRSWWVAGGDGRRAVAGIVSLALATTSVSVFLLYVSAFDLIEPVLPYDGTQGSPGYTAAARGVASYLVTAVLLVIPLLLVHRRRTTPGIATALVAIVAVFPITMHEFPRIQTTAAVAAVVGAVLVDWILPRLDRARGLDALLRLPIAGAVFAAVVFSAHLLALHFASGIRWPVELWSGVVVLSVAAAMLLGGLAARPRQDW